MKLGFILIASLFLSTLAFAINGNSDKPIDTGTPYKVNSNSGSNDGTLASSNGGDTQTFTDDGTPPQTVDWNHHKGSGTYVRDGGGSQDPVLCFSQTSEGKYNWELVASDGTIIDFGTLE